MRPHALLLTALLLAPLSGCLGGEGATALDVLPRARAIAAEWNADAELAGVATVEVGELPAFVKRAIAESGEGDGPQAQLLRHEDRHVGDGRAGAWAFGFRSGGQELALVLDAGGRELMRHEGGGHGDSPALGEVAIDSDRAMDLAAQGNGTFAKVRSGAMLASLVLAPGAHGPAWLLMVLGTFTQEGEGDSAFAMVDATSGNVTMGDDFSDYGFGGDGTGGEPASAAAASPYHHPRGNRTYVRTETGGQDGTLTAVRPADAAPFELRAAHGELRLRLDLPNAAPASQATAIVTSPDGRVTRLTFAAGLTGSAPAQATLEDAAEGSYGVAIHLDAGVLQPYAFSWCAPGSRMAAQDPSSACGEA